MPVSQDDVNALNAAIAAGERTVRYRDRTIEYRSVGELIAARNDLRNELAEQEQAGSGAARPRHSYLTQMGRGF